MLIERVTTGKRYVRTVLVSEESPAFNTSARHPVSHPDSSIKVDLGYDNDNRSVALCLTVEEAEKLQARLAEALVMSQKHWPKRDV